MDVVVKYSPSFDTLFSHSLKSFIPTYLESSKSFRVLLFDQEKGIVKFLDNTLTDVKGQIDLADFDVLQAVLICESFNGNAFWILDQGSMQLIKVDFNMNILTRIDGLRFLFEDKVTPSQIFEK